MVLYDPMTGTGLGVFLWPNCTSCHTSLIAEMNASKQDIKNRKVRPTLSIFLLRRRGRYHIQPLPLHTYVNMFGLHGEECALRLPYKISGPFPRRLPFRPPLAKRADAAASIIQPQFSCSGATCYGSVVPGSPPQAAAAMRGLTSLMGWQEIAVKRSKVPVTALMKAGHGVFLGSQCHRRSMSTLLPFCFIRWGLEFFSAKILFIYLLFCGKLPTLILLPLPESED